MMMFIFFSTRHRRGTHTVIVSSLILEEVKDISSLKIQNVFQMWDKMQCGCAGIRGHSSDNGMCVYTTAP